MTQQSPLTSNTEGASSGPQPAGNMTAVMRAVASSGPKVLRIGLIQGGRVIEERIIKQRTSVTVGANEKNMFVIPVETCRRPSGSSRSWVPTII
jgi:hypothetical protein